MADSDTTQQADMKKLLAEANAIIANSQAKHEAHEKALAEANAIIANSQAKREAQKKALAEAKQADTPSAEPFLTTAQWLSVISLAASLAGF